jgi:hypothetical protein
VKAVALHSAQLYETKPPVGNRQAVFTAVLLCHNSLAGCTLDKNGTSNASTTPEPNSPSKKKLDKNGTDSYRGEAQKKIFCGMTGRQAGERCACTSQV